MRTAPSPRVRLLAVLALILAASGVAFLLIHGSGGNNSANGAPSATVPVVTRPRTTPKPEKPKKKQNQQVEGVAALDASLVSHPVVVVSVYAQNVSTDTEAMNEAKAGAASVGAGFVAFNVYEEKIARQLGTLLGSNFEGTTPAVLIFKRPRKLAFEHDGFVDSKVVAQAAYDAYPHEEPWVTTANNICARYNVLLNPLQKKIQSAATTSAGQKQTSTAMIQAATTIDQEVNTLEAVRATASKASTYRRFLAGAREIAVNLRAEANAIDKNDQSAGQTAAAKNTTLTSSVSALASELQLTTCSS
jgi:hypothetical protein